jgi:5,10-methylene-tetrahydrofolate dehydrogenase/methenyl tetrahydrofolate cyclohydrolase
MKTPCSLRSGGSLEPADLLHQRRYRAAKILRGLKREISKSEIRPGLAVVLVGKNPASELYTALKQKAVGEIGMDFWLLKFPAQEQKALIYCARLR